MHAAQILAQELSTPDSSGSGEWIVWIGLAIGIVLLWLLIRNTRMKAYRDYWDRRKAEEQRRLNDPDMAQPPEPDNPSQEDRGQRTED